MQSPETGGTPAAPRDPVLASFLSEHELANELRFSVRTLARWRRLGEGPAITRLGRKIFYSRAAVDAWLAAQQIAA